MSDDPTSAPPEDEPPAVLDVVRPGGRRAFLQSLSAGVVAGAVAHGCNDGPSSPSTTSVSTSTTSVPTSTTTVRPTSTSTSTSSSTTSIAPTFTLTGQVTNSTTQRNVGGAMVEVISGPNSGKSTTTDPNGRYELNGLVAGTFVVRVTASGFATQTSTVTLTGNQSLQFTIVSNTTTTSQPPVTSTTTASGGGGGVTLHYWYPN
jgi:hypothetical protein